MPLEKEKLKQALTAAFDDFISTLESFPEDRINKVPFPGSWTPAQVAVHITKATRGVPDHQTKPSDREVDAMLPKIRPWWEDLNQKFKAPEPLLPDDGHHEKSALLAALKAARETDLTIIKGKDLSEICMDFPLPTIGFLTRYEWLWFIQMHLKRHLFQLENMLHI
ncbi:DinB family protein [Flavihumibacter petaseus]|uniref:DinB-like domain-containing protein n=1 Tax=Flavihumibacter petaseus NBRC 106054 TaxID=1220578 RepID=A0A0E9MWQ7_9BACT|nr:DinB family protein [Flavihumibacter petaseus]GAO41928.1 hypothetical protein FPE01S_01_09430 [Flavihumibacter petaseus NBRC 106054]